MWELAGCHRGEGGSTPRLADSGSAIRRYAKRKAGWGSRRPVRIGRRYGSRWLSTHGHVVY